jgi:hypothetical protein
MSGIGRKQRIHIEGRKRISADETNKTGCARMDKLYTWARRAAFAGGLALALLGLLEGLVQLLGFSLVRHLYTAGRLLEFATMLMVFVVAFELRAPGRPGLERDGGLRR